MFENHETTVLLETNYQGLLYLIIKTKYFHKIIFIEVVFNHMKKRILISLTDKTIFQMYKFLIDQMMVIINFSLSIICKTNVSKTKFQKDGSQWEGKRTF